jgi:hypothetical protein
VRTVYLVKAEGPDIDKTWNTVNVIIAGKTEGDFGIICACAPSLRSAFQYHFCGHGATNGSGSGATGQPSNSRLTDTDTAPQTSPSGKRNKEIQKPWTQRWSSPTPTEEFPLHERVVTSDSGNSLGIIADAYDHEHDPNLDDVSILQSSTLPKNGQRFGNYNDDIRRHDFTAPSLSAVPKPTILESDRISRPSVRSHHIADRLRLARPRNGGRRSERKSLLPPVGSFHSRTSPRSWNTLDSPEVSNEGKKVDAEIDASLR